MPITVGAVSSRAQIELGAQRSTFALITADPAAFRRSLARVPSASIEAALVDVFGKNANGASQISNNAFADANGHVHTARMIEDLKRGLALERFAAALDKRGVQTPAADAQLSWRVDGSRIEVPAERAPRGAWLGAVSNALVRGFNDADDLRDALHDIGMRLDMLAGSGSLDRQVFQVLDELDRNGQLNDFLAVVATFAAAPVVNVAPVSGSGAFDKVLGGGRTGSGQPTTTSTSTTRPSHPGLLVKSQPSAAVERAFAEALSKAFSSGDLEMLLLSSKASALAGKINFAQPTKFLMSDVVFELRKQPSLLPSFVDAVRTARSGRDDIQRLCDQMIASGLRPAPESGVAPRTLDSMSSSLSAPQRKALDDLVAFVRSAFGGDDTLLLVRELSPAALSAVPVGAAPLQRTWDNLAAYLATHDDDRATFLAALVRDRAGRPETRGVVDGINAAFA